MDSSAALQSAMDLYYRIKEQRRSIEAPVDTMGCGSVSPGLCPRDSQFRILVALLLSSQTRDEITHEAVSKLSARLGGLTPEAVAGADEAVLRECLSKVGFHNRKTEYLRGVSARLTDAPMPSSLEELLSLPGIGKKMAFLYLQHACNQNAGIGVDTHVHRISRRIGLCPEAKTAEGARVALEAKVDRSEWRDFNTVLVGFGQTICTAKQPKCSECCVSDKCPASSVRLSF